MGLDGAMKKQRAIASFWLAASVVLLAACDSQATSPTATSAAPLELTRTSCEDIGAVAPQDDRVETCYVGNAALPLSAAFSQIAETVAPANRWRPVKGCEL